MSLILNALRKLDREKASRRKGGPNIASEILRPDSPRAQGKTYRYLVAFSLTALATAGLTYAVVVGFGLRGKTSLTEPSVSHGAKQPAAGVPAESALSSKSSPSLPVSPPVLKRQAAAVPPQTGSAAKPSPPATGRPPAPPKQAKAGPPKAAAEEKSSSPSPLSAPPPAPRQQVAPVPPPPELARDARSEPIQTPAKVSDLAGGRTPAASPEERKPSPNAVPQEAEVSRGDARKPGVPAVDESPSTLPPLKITGIVWNEEPSKRRAIINGAFLNEGSMIEGVKVEEILPTQVRFLYKGQAFQITVF
jgi:general secretion pathway protein B